MYIRQHSRRSQLAIDAHNVLAEMGIPMHTDQITKIVYRRRGEDLNALYWWSAEFKLKTKLVRDAIYAHPELFERLRPGVYFLTGKAPNIRRYRKIAELPIISERHPKSRHKSSYND